MDKLYNAIKAKWQKRINALKVIETYIFLISGAAFIIGVIYPVLNFLFYAGFIYPLYKIYKGDIKKTDLFYFTVPYCLVLGVGIWNYIFPYYIGMILALSLPDLFSKLLYKAVNLTDKRITRIFVLPAALFVYDFIFQKLPYLKQIEVIPVLSPIFNHTFILSAGSVIGSHLTLFFIVLSLSTITALVASRKQVSLKLGILIVCAAVLILPAVGKTNTIKTDGKRVKVAAVQGKIITDRSFGTDYVAFSKFITGYYNDIIGDEKADIFVLPETLAGVYDSFKSKSQDNLKEFIKFAKQRDGLVSGIVFEKNFKTNSKKSRYATGILVNKNKVVGMSRKRNLVPFSETKTFNKGKDYSVFDTEYGKIGISICYDTNYGTVEKLKKNGAQIILSPFNDAGFGRIYHTVHRYYPIMEAIQCRIPIIQANYDGVSQLINNKGVVVKSLDFNDKGVISHTFLVKSTPSIYITFGMYLQIIFFAFILLWTVYTKIKIKTKV